ncbi:hypothetical protein Cantr_04130 [Candida viswanathii]|uniref:Uncharacterized protein n=1 Tax=Candida viswanathii TaxID=5486 RepID=A0A367XNU5_9ASCO|nr:hypothetical protein Cantr_04130 [Candida viswanathii]
MSFTFTRQRSSSVNSLSSNHSITPCVNNNNNNMSGSGASSGLSHPSTPVPPNIPTSQPHHLPPLPPLSLPPAITNNTNNTTTSSSIIQAHAPPPTSSSSASSSMDPERSRQGSPAPLAAGPSSSHASTTPILPPLTSTAIGNKDKDSVAPTPNSLRSMSIVSLDRSPRNSIISIDDNLRSHTRNNSTTSLVSLSGHSATHGFTHIHSKQSSSGMAGSNSSAIISDDDSEFDSSTPSRTILKPMHRFKRRSTSKEGPLKRDFKFKFDDSNPHLLPHHHQPPTSPTLFATLPHSLSGSPTSTASSSRLTDPISSPNSTLIPTDPKNLKKLKTSNLIQQSMYIKRKLAISKDLQLEFYNSISSNSGTSANSNSHTSLNSSISATSPSTPPPVPPLSPPIISSELLDSKFFSPLLPSAATRKSVSSPPIPNTLIPPNFPIMQTLQEQNELINKLNRRWNKAIINDIKPKELKKDSPAMAEGSVCSGSDGVSGGSGSGSDPGSGSTSATTVNPRKRSRRILFDSDYDYEGYDDYNYDIYDN